MFNLEILTPETPILMETVNMAVIPGQSGLFGVLSGHASFMSKINHGVVEIYKHNDKDISDKYFIADGFADVNNNICKILVKYAMRLNAINVEANNNKISILSEKLLSSLISDHDKIKIQSEIDILKAMNESISL